MITSKKTRLLLAAACAALAAHALPPAAAAATDTADVQLVLTGLRNGEGQVVISLCTVEDKFPSGCRKSQTVKAEAGVVKYVFKGLPAGQYAIAAIHDEDSNQRLTMSAAGWPAEGFGFSNNAISRSGVPDFKAAAFDARGERTVTVQMRYMR
ncbi:DUF2141 domain-containing protein [Paucibacter sp. DJ1R-11]|uniref:DUF2141 domain-containing protein n=1 Tax=Paucibacter sp. DJ1R-11 TaxID=2893556 RepID=UPI0021E37127|nr:DUF2141 domain-containing protein [Paucibacter sp. DJ1R-11]MCV2365764.1 DUF2141 domain-containing protein [Paucibacter sp. DJ1R-11]